MDNKTLNLGNITEDEWFDIYLEHAEGKRSDLIPFPSEDVQKVTNLQSGRQSALAAIGIWKTIKGILAENVEMTDKIRVLDYGCGWGRITRLLPFYFRCEGLHGVDVDERLIASANELVPQINFSVIKSMEPLPFENDSFDLVFANSVFSHLSERSALVTLSELARITSKGGLMVISVLEKTEMEKFYANAQQKTWIEGILGDQEKASAELEAKGFVWGDTRRWKDYGIAIVSDAWMQARFEENGLRFVSSERTSNKGSQNYKAGIKT